MVLLTKLLLHFTSPGKGSLGFLHPSLTSLTNCSIAPEYLQPAQPFLNSPLGPSSWAHKSFFGLAILSSHEFIGWSHIAVKSALPGLVGGHPSCFAISVGYWASYNHPDFGPCRLMIFFNILGNTIFRYTE